MVAVGVYGGWAAVHLGRRGADTTAWDQVLVNTAMRMVPPPVHLRTIQPRNDRELYLMTVVSDQQDILSGLMVFVLRMILSATVAGLGLVLLVAGATEWEVRSALTGARGDPPNQSAESPETSDVFGHQSSGG
jgi:hypothetical protein